VGRPSYDDATLNEYFSGISPALVDDPMLGPVLKRLAVEDPDILAAVADVDRSQIRDCAARSPRERLRAGAARWNGLARYRQSG
jgi:hypothetical protein